MLPQLISNSLRFYLIKPKFVRLYATINNEPLKFNIPSLNQTLDKYSKYLQPLVSESEYKHAKELLSKFVKPNGEGEILQKLLQEKANRTENWLSEWWKNVAYLDGREPIVINSNPGISLPTEKFRNTDEWLNYSAKLLISVLKYKLLIDNGKLPQDYHKSEPLCMDQYYTLFNACRIPGPRKDEIITCKPHLLNKHERPSYITVVHRNRFFVMEVIDQNSQMIYSKEAIFRGFCEILNNSQSDGDPIGLMTAENRNVWGISFSRLQEIPKNRESFSYLQKSILLFCLDKPVFLEKYNRENPNSVVARNMLHGNGYDMNSGNRWFDKTIQVIVSSDGACGMNYEHTPAEAVALLNMVDYAYKDMLTANEDSSGIPKLDVCHTKEIKFSLDNKSMAEIDASKNNINSLTNDLELHSVSFKEFGKTKIKNIKVSPDAFIQMGIQLGYYNLHKGPGSTYESGSLRRFKLGRTDTIRSCSPESFEFCKAVNNPNATISEQRKLLLLAIERHISYTKEVLMGQGIDRHLLGLKLIAIENRRNIPELFMDTSYAKAFHHVLSTSQCSSAVDLTLCYGPLVPDGYGFCYNTQPNQINYCVAAINSSPTTDALSLSKTIADAWKKIIDLLQN